MLETTGIPGSTFRLNLGGIDLYMTCAEENGALKRVLLSSMQAGSDQGNHVTSLAKQINRALDRGKPVEHIAEKLRGVQEPRVPRLVIGPTKVHNAETFAELVGAVLVERYGRKEAA